MVRILAVCTGNTCRSPMLMAALQDEFHDKNCDVDVESAGVGACAAGNLMAAEHAQTCFPGLLDEHRSTHISHKALSNYDLILCMTQGHRDAVLEEMAKQQDKLGGNEAKIRVFPGGLEDPVGGPLSLYESCATHCRTWAQAIGEEIMGARD